MLNSMHSKTRSEIDSDLQVARVVRPGLEELFVTATLRAGDDGRAMFGKVHRLVREAGATIVAEDVYGVPISYQSALANGEENGRCVDWPVTWLNDGADVYPGLAGLQLHAIQGAAVDRIERNGCIVGSVFDDGVARHCRLGGLLPPDLSAPPEQQARATFELMEVLLQSIDMDFTQVIRTWLYLDRILGWYHLFNRVRDVFFQERKIFEKIVPASTAIGGVNPAGAALMAGAYAVQPNDGSVTICAVPSPLQSPALEYGSSFSRALELAGPGHRRLWISGTASIGLDGQTLWTDNLVEQINLTMNVVAAILESRGMSWPDATRAVAYVKEKSATKAFQDYCFAHGLHLPAVTSQNEICREELLFEIELDACRHGASSNV